MKKKYIFLGILAIVCVGAYYLTPSLETIVKQVVHKYGSQITGTEVTCRVLTCRSPTAKVQSKA